MLRSTARNWRVMRSFMGIAGLQVESDLWPFGAGKSRWNTAEEGSQCAVLSARLSENREPGTEHFPMIPAPTRLRLRLSPAAEKAVRGGHPWVFSDSVRDQNREGVAGELAVIYSRSDQF